MARRGQAKIRKIDPDPIYGDLLVAKLINRAMYDGKKSVAEHEIYEALKLSGEKFKKAPLEVFHEALDKIRPTMEVRPRRVGGASYQVPMAVRGVRRDSLALRWLVTAARKRSNSDYHTFALKLAAEFADAVNGEGGAVKKRLDVEKIAEANRAFSHFRW